MIAKSRNCHVQNWQPAQCGQVTLWCLSHIEIKVCYILNADFALMSFDGPLNITARIITMYKMFQVWMSIQNKTRNSRLIEKQNKSMKKHKPLGSVHPVNNKSMPSKHLTIHTVIKIYNFCPKWSIHQEYVAWKVFSFFSFWQQSPSMYSLKLHLV